MTLRWIIAGCRGQLGSAMQQQLASDPDCEVVAAVDLPEVDLADRGAVAALFGGLDSPVDFLVNAAAFTHVDRCEREPEAAHRGNVLAPEVLAEACARHGVRLVHVSTDYVFAGDSETPYTEDDSPAPKSGYGRTKLAGEQAVLSLCPDALIVRTSWVFGRGRNFIAAILDQARKRRTGESDGPLEVVADQHGRPTYAYDLAGGIVSLLKGQAHGIFHIANSGVATWWDLARAVLDTTGFSDLSVSRIRTDELSLDAPRPAWSVLDTSKAEAAGIAMRSWQDALSAYLESDDSPIGSSNRADSAS
jgi:dTDP-4-dehydrorhamnose reductase